MEKLIIPIVSTVIVILIGIVSYIIFKRITLKEKEKATKK